MAKFMAMVEQAWDYQLYEETSKTTKPPTAEQLAEMADGAKA